MVGLTLRARCAFLESECDFDVLALASGRRTRPSIDVGAGEVCCRLLSRSFQRFPIVTGATLALGIRRTCRIRSCTRSKRSVPCLSSAQTRLVRRADECRWYRCADNSPGALKKLEHTDIEVYTVGETIWLDPSVTTPPNMRVTSACLPQGLSVGPLCTNAVAVRNEGGHFVGQPTDAVLPKVLSLFGMPINVRYVSFLSGSPF